MLNSLDAIRAKLVELCPTVTRTYVNSIPAGFIRPSFFVEQIASSTEPLTSRLLRTVESWQVTYFATADAANNPDIREQIEVGALLREAFMEGGYLTNSETVDEVTTTHYYHVLDYSEGQTDGEIYGTIRLHIDRHKGETTYDLMGESTLTANFET